MNREALSERINELCHRMTLADTREVRMWLCAELKAAIAQWLEAGQ